MYCIVEDGVVVTTHVDVDSFPMAILAAEDIICGDLYDGADFHRVAPRPEPKPEPEPEPESDIMTWSAYGEAIREGVNSIDD